MADSDGMVMDRMDGWQAKQIGHGRQIDAIGSDFFFTSFSLPPHSVYDTYLDYILPCVARQLWLSLCRYVPPCSTTLYYYRAPALAMQLVLIYFHCVLECFSPSFSIR